MIDQRKKIEQDITKANTDIGNITGDIEILESRLEIEYETWTQKEKNKYVETMTNGERRRTNYQKLFKQLMNVLKMTFPKVKMSAFSSSKNTTTKFFRFSQLASLSRKDNLIISREEGKKLAVIQIDIGQHEDADTSLLYISPAIIDRTVHF